jgi:hypothetical protein
MITVTAVGKECLLAIGNFPDGVEWEASFRINGNWVKVEPPPTYPERWINVYPWLPVGRDLVVSCLSRDLADQNAGSRRIAVIHLAADGTVTLHPTTGGAS